MRTLVLGAVPALLLLATAAPGLAAPNYTDHRGEWVFTDPLGLVAGPPIQSILLKLNDNSGWTAFVEPLFWHRPPTLAFECYGVSLSGILIVHGEDTPIHGDCTLGQELVNGQRRFVVRFVGEDVPITGVGTYEVRPIGA